MDELQDASRSDAVSGAQENDTDIPESTADTVQEGGSGHGTEELTYITAAGGKSWQWPAYIILVWLSSIQLYPPMWSIRQSSDHCFVAVDASMQVEMCEMLAVSVVMKNGPFSVAKSHFFM